jgi:alginate O-acetyltransferase complex protein AlgI
MLFPSLTFVVFFAPVFALAWLFHKKSILWKSVLVIASIVFYGWWSTPFLLLLLGNVFLNFCFGQAISKYEQHKKIILWLAVGANLAVLATFKYYKFFYINFVEAFPNLSDMLPALELILPVGISFYTFQGISYVVDIYRREISARNLLDVMCFQMFFPQLVAGPIVRANHFIPQLDHVAHLTTPAFNRGLLLVLWGLVLKLVSANYLAQLIVDDVFTYPDAFDASQVLTAIYCYAIQIYCDFAGYSLMAIGIAAMLGFSLPENFRTPYFATSLQDFWRRWHISLSFWLRDYLYVPLGGNRGGINRTLVNLMIVMVLGGLWHGAGWNFIIWGALHGIGLSANVLLRRAGIRVPKFLGWFVTFHYVCVGWVFFRASDLDVVRAIFDTLSFGDWSTMPTFGLMFLFAMPLLIDWIVDSKVVGRMAPRILGGNHLWITALALAIVVMILVIAPPTEAPFIYFQF